MLTGAQLMCRVLLEEGVDVMFGYPGGAIMPFYHALPEFPELRHILVRHEQAAAHAADGYARASGQAGVCVATSGPGATNLVTGLATAYMDNSPVVAITGQVSRAMMGRDAFQETDIIGVTLPITKWSVLVEDITTLADTHAQGLRGGARGATRPGAHRRAQGRAEPAHCVRARARWRRCPARRRCPKPGRSPTPRTSLPQAERPLILAGHGIILGNASEDLKVFAEHTGIPVITTLLGISAFPEDHPLHLGHAGHARGSARQPGHPARRPAHRGRACASTTA